MQGSTCRWGTQAGRFQTPTFSITSVVLAIQAILTSRIAAARTGGPIKCFTMSEQLADLGQAYKKMPDKWSSDSLLENDKGRCDINVLDIFKNMPDKDISNRVMADKGQVLLEQGFGTGKEYHYDIREVVNPPTHTNFQSSSPFGGAWCKFAL